MDVEVKSNVAEYLKQFDATCEQLLYLIGTECVAGAVKAISGEDLAVDTGRLRASISFVTAAGQKDKQLQIQTPRPQGASHEGNDVKSSDYVFNHGNAPENSVIIGTNVEYAVYVHEGLGTNKGKGARRFLTHGIQNAEPRIKQKAEQLFTKKGGD